MTSTLLKDFAAKAKHVAEPQERTFTSPFKDDTAYLIAITAMTVQKRPSGYNSLELSVSKVLSDDTEKPAGRLWVSLPVYAEEILQTMDAVKLMQMRQISQNELLQLLAAALPEHLGANVGNLRDRTAAAVGIAEALVEAENSDGYPLDLTGAKLFYTAVRGKKKNKRGEIPVYHNFSAEAPERFPLAEEQPDGVPF